MKKKLLFLTAAFALMAMPSSVLTSCSKDDEPQRTEQTASVANTIWIADDNTEIAFYSDGTCKISGINRPYHQSGSMIDFEGITIMYRKEFYKTRYAYVKGNILELELYSSNVPTFIVTFRKGRI